MKHPSSILLGQGYNPGAKGLWPTMAPVRSRKCPTQPHVIKNYLPWRHHVHINRKNTSETYPSMSCSSVPATLHWTFWVTLLMYSISAHWKQNTMTTDTEKTHRSSTDTWISRSPNPRSLMTDVNSWNLKITISTEWGGDTRTVYLTSANKCLF